MSNVYAWGDNRHGQLGINNFIPKVNKPYLFTGKLSIAKIACGTDHTLCLTTGGRVYLWGTYYLNARQGDRRQPTGSAGAPKLIASLADKVIIDIAAGAGHNLAIAEDHTPYAWGSGMQGQLGLDLAEAGNYLDAQPVHTGARVKQIAAGVAHSCAVTQENRLLVWGANRSGQLGYPTKLAVSYRPIIFGGFLDALTCCPELLGKNGDDLEMQDSALDYKYEDVQCGSASTVAQIDKSPYLLIWGYESHKAWGFPKLFDKDRPARFQVVAQMLYVLTENGLFYRINCDKRTYEVVQGGDSQEESKGGGDAHMQDEAAAVSDFTCGADFLLTMRGNQTLFARGGNGYGQLGIGSFEDQDQF